MDTLDTTDAASGFLALHNKALLADADPVAVQNLIYEASERPDDLMYALSGRRTEGFSRKAAYDALSSVAIEDIAGFGSPYAFREFDREVSGRNGEFLSAVAAANGLTVDQVDQARSDAYAGRSVPYDLMLAEYFSR